MAKTQSYYSEPIQNSRIPISKCRKKIIQNSQNTTLFVHPPKTVHFEEIKKNSKQMVDETAPENHNWLLTSRAFYSQGKF